LGEISKFIDVFFVRTKIIAGVIFARRNVWFYEQLKSGDFGSGESLEPARDKMSLYNVDNQQYRFIFKGILNYKLFCHLT